MTTDQTIPSRHVERPCGAAALHLAGVGPADDAGAGADVDAGTLAPAVANTVTTAGVATATVTADPAPAPAPAPDAGTGAGARDGTGAAATPVTRTGAVQLRVPVWSVRLRRARSWLDAAILGRFRSGGGDRPNSPAGGTGPP